MPNSDNNEFWHDALLAFTELCKVIDAENVEEFKWPTFSLMKITTKLEEKLSHVKAAFKRS